MICPKCKGRGVKDGLDYRTRPPRQRYRCRLKGGCGHAWTEAQR